MLKALLEDLVVLLGVLLVPLVGMIEAYTHNLVSHNPFMHSGLVKACMAEVHEHYTQHLHDLLAVWAQGVHEPCGPGM